jgi:hypothetical protein
MSKGQRIYHFHVRKTAGSSLDAAFYALGGLEGLSVHNQSSRGTTVGNGLAFVGANKPLIEGGDYFYGTSHFPAWWLDIPPGTFTVTILRDPVSRAISYYRYLLWARRNPTAVETEPYIKEILDEAVYFDGGLASTSKALTMRTLRQERTAIQTFGPLAYLRRLDPRRWESEFRNFVTRVPPRSLLTQLHMFSERFDPVEAAERILACSAVCFTETFSEDLAQLGQTLGLELGEHSERRFGERVELDEPEREMLRECLAPEYEMLEPVRAGLATRPSSAVLAG